MNVAQGAPGTASPGAALRATGLRLAARLRLPVAALAAAGTAGLALTSRSGGSALDQALPAFVLVGGLLVLGAVADAEGVFTSAAARVERLPGSTTTLFTASLVLVAAVTAVLNLDTAVVFLTPVVIGAAEHRGVRHAPFLYGTVVMANGASLLLPGANLTNLMVLGVEHVPGSVFLARMAAPAIAAVIATLVVLLVRFRKDLRAGSPRRDTRPARVPRAGALGIGATAAAAALVLLLPHPAAAIAALAVLVALIAVAGDRATSAGLLRAADLPVLVVLLFVSVALGTLARVWGAPAELLSHAGVAATAGIAAIASVAVNNLPATVLLTGGAVPHPRALLVGLNLGPNLFVTGSLAVYLWWRAALRAGARPTLRGYVSAGVPAALAGSLAALAAIALTARS